ncbi:MAG: glycosyltransferase [Deltaproteobacteria bacterium]|nr:glycosyltransferase [Deltaproteobacteria bacterium]
MKIDLHVHSKFSTRPSQWVLQKIGCPESFTDPVRLRDIALKKGMSMVTITDHNTIEGALVIAHLPDVFVSEEVTTYFPEDGCKIHILALNISERQHRDIQRVRSSIFDLAISQILKLPIIGTYHTSLPQYAGYLTEDSAIEDLMWKYVLWYYKQMDLIYVPSKSTREEIEEKGVAPDNIRLFPRGVDTSRFHPAKRDLQFLQQYMDVDAFKLLYVGRISKEKNLPVLVDVFKEISHAVEHVSLVVAGDGPYLSEMKSQLQGTRTCFTGYLKGESLAKVYASCDLFIFPSTTDTFGNVVLEAQASQIPVIITDIGGPHENIIPGETGIMVPAHDGAAMVAAIKSLMNHPEKMRQMGKAARQYAESRSFQRAFEHTWAMYMDPDMGPVITEEDMAVAV